MPYCGHFDDFLGGLTIRVERSELEEHEEGFLPKYTILKAIGDGVNLEAELEIRSKVNKEYDLPFDPPEDYERKQSCKIPGFWWYSSSCPLTS